MRASLAVEGLAGPAVGGPDEGGARTDSFVRQPMHPRTRKAGVPWVLGGRTIQDLRSTLGGEAEQVIRADLTNGARIGAAGAGGTLLPWRPDQSAPARDGMGGKGHYAHRHDGSLRTGQGPDRREELIRPAAIDDAQDGAPALGQVKRPLAPILRLLVALDEPPPGEAVHEPARGRRGSADRFGQLADGQGAAVGQYIEGGQLRETQAQLPELAGKADDQFPPKRPTHRDALADLADIWQAIAGCQDRR